MMAVRPIVEEEQRSLAGARGMMAVPACRLDNLRQNQTTGGIYTLQRMCSPRCSKSLRRCVHLTQHLVDSGTWLLIHPEAPLI